MATICPDTVDRLLGQEDGRRYRENIFKGETSMTYRWPVYVWKNIGIKDDSLLLELEKAGYINLAVGNIADI